MRGAVSRFSPAVARRYGAWVLAAFLLLGPAGSASAQQTVFVTRAAVGGNVTVAGADALCAAEAQQADLANPAQFRAWLSTATVDARDRIPPGDGPFVLPDGTVVAANRTDLLDGSVTIGKTDLLTDPPNTPQGDTGAPNFLITHPSYAMPANGVIFDLTLRNDSDTTGESIDLLVLRPLGGGNHQVIHRVPVVNEDVPGATSGTKTYGIGVLAVQAGDVLAHWGASPLHPIPYDAAALPDGGDAILRAGTASSDVDPGDIVNLGASGNREYFLNVQFVPEPILLAPISQYADETPVAGLEPWTGTRPDGTLSNPNATCMDWSSNFPLDGGDFGDVTSVGVAWTFNDFASCNTERPLYCFGPPAPPPPPPVPAVSGWGRATLLALLGAAMSFVLAPRKRTRSRVTAGRSAP